MQWWGHSKEHGWVVLDRSIPGNSPGPKQNLLFFRCRDAMTFVEVRKNWVSPAYNYAPNYIGDLSPGASADAAEELEAFKAQWPEFQQQLHQEYAQTEARDQAARTEADKLQDEAAGKKKRAVRKPAAAEKKPAA